MEGGVGLGVSAGVCAADGLRVACSSSLVGLLQPPLALLASSLVVALLSSEE